MTRKQIIVLLVLLLPSLLYVFLTTGKHNFIRVAYYGPKETVKKIVDGKEQIDTIYHSIPPFRFVNQDGDTITQEQYKGKIYVADFFFTTCQSICPKMAANLMTVQTKFKDYDSVAILSHTVNPEIDTVAVLKRYSEMVHANTKRWNFVTGKRSDIYNLAIKGYLLPVAEDEAAEGGFLHSEQLVLVDKDAHIRGFYDGTSIVEINKLNDDIKTLMAEYFIKDEKKKK